MNITRSKVISYIDVQNKKYRIDIKYQSYFSCKGDTIQFPRGGGWKIHYLYRTVHKVNNLFHAESARNLLLKKPPAPPPPLGD